jgi:hypothetical protein
MGLLRLVLSLFFRAFRSSGAWKEAVSRAVSHPDVVSALGPPVRPGAWVGGRLAVSGPRGNAAFTVPLHGQSCGGALRVVARKEGGVWRFDLLQVQVRGGPCIDLLREGGRDLPPPRRALFRP